MRYNFFKDIEEGLKSYPLLHWSNKDDKRVIAGRFIAHKGDIEIEEYEVEISFSKDYPHDMPFVVETSNKIQPRNATRHIFVEGNLCFGNKQDTLRLCKKGISFKWFLDKTLNPHLCREYVRDKTGEYPAGERSHKAEGNWEGYYELFKTTDKESILKNLSLLVAYPTFSKNKECYCGSGKKYKRCHEKWLPIIFDIGRNNVEDLFNELQTDFNSYKP
ncbi:MAG TPA: SEC-C domain-containing protein [Parafilimonas sp.]|nr:SEC-C domain-containing protein [Parafilimonas sp.]